MKPQALSRMGEIRRKGTSVCVVRENLEGMIIRSTKWGERSTKRQTILIQQDLWRAVQYSHGIGLE